MGVKLVTPPTVTPIECVGLAELKLHLRCAADVTDEDSLIAAYCASAWDYCQRICWRQFLTAGYRLTMPSWFTQNVDAVRSRSFGRLEIYIPIPKPPLIAVQSVEYYDQNNALQTWSAGNYRVDDQSDVAELWSVVDLGFPTLYPRQDAVRVNYTAGYGTTSAEMPAALLHAVRLLVGDYYETREPAKVETTAVDALLASIACRDSRLLEFV